MIRLNTLRNNTIDKIVNVLNTVKYVPSDHDAAIDAIVNDADLTDSQKVKALRKYFETTAIQLFNDKYKLDTSDA